MRKKKIIINVLLAVCMFFTTIPIMPVQATCANGICNNGLGGIYIDINSAPYTTFQTYSMGNNAYGDAGCAWYASARVNQLTGKGNIIWSGSTWYNNAATYGFTKSSTTPQSGSIICWSGHVAILEKIEGSTAYISEGGNRGVGSAYGYCTLKTVEVSNISKMNSGFIGYVYLGVSVQTTPPSVTNVRVTEQTPDYYTVTCDLNNYTSGYVVKFATWTADVQDDLTWDDATVSGNTASFTIRRSDHNSEYGTYYTHVYIYPNGSGTPVASNKDLPGVIIENEPPVITNAKITDITTDSYKVTCTVSDNVGVTSVLFPTWTDEGGFDDLSQPWPEGQIKGNTVTYTVKRSEHNNEFGRYNTHIYAYDKCGNFSMVPLTVDLTEVDSEGWTYSDSLPSDITSDKYDIQYQNTFTKEQTSSPGNGWKNEGLVRTEYQDNGQPYWSNIELETSEFRTLIQYKYYHFCGASTGNVANFEQSGNFVHYDEITDVNAVNIETSGRDADNTNYIYYKLRWKSNVWNTWQPFFYLVSYRFISGQDKGGYL
jgi:hypothetical protein